MINKVLRRISVRGRVVGGFLILIMFLTLFVPLTITDHLSLTSRVEQLANVNAKSNQLLLSALADILSSRVNLMRYADDLSPSVNDALNDVRNAMSSIEEARNLAIEPKQKSAMANILAGLVSYSTLITDVQTARIENRPQDVATLLSNSYQLEFNLEQQIRTVVNTNTALVEETNRTTLAEAQQSLILLVASYAVALLLAIGIAIAIQQSITRPVSELREGAETFQRERRATNIPSEGTDELSLLAQTFNQITLELSQTLAGLEQRVADRTQALATVAEIGTAVSTTLDLKTILQEIVERSKERFHLYHSHIYLLDEANENLVLTAGAGEAGRIMAERGHSIPLAREQSLVARAARERKGVIVNDVTQEADFLPNPLLPETRAEMAVPMLIGKRLIGVFDVQSEQVGRFTEADVAVHTTLASQVAVAIENARLYAQAELSRQETQSLLEYATEGILILDLTSGLFSEPNAAAAAIYGLPREELVKVGPAKMSPPRQPDGRDSAEKAMEMIAIAMEKGVHIFEWTHINGQGNSFPCEIRLVRLPGDKPRLRVTVTDITERKRLEERELTVLRARQQEMLNVITQKIQTATTVESALQIAARELGRALGMKPTVVTLAPTGLAERPEKVNHQ